MPVDDLSIIILLIVREEPRRKKLQTIKRMKIKNETKNDTDQEAANNQTE